MFFEICCAVEFFNASLSSTYSSQYYFTISKLFKHWTSWSCVHRSVLQWTRGGRVPLSLDFISILWRLVMTAFHRRPKRRRFFPFPNNHRRPSSFFFYFYNTFYHFFSTFTTRPSISSLLQRPTGHESRRFSCRCRIKKLFYFYFFHLIKLFNKYKKSNKIVNNEKRNRPLLWPLSISFNYQRIFWSCILLWISRIYLNVFLIFQHFNKMKAIKLAIWYKIINIA